jgi:phosphoribosylaminoimidazole-succinocarboxamide synthase
VNTARQNKLIPVYEGSVKRVFECPWQPDSLLFQFTDDYSIFDWGKMPDAIENKGRALALMGAWFFERLCRPDAWSEPAAAGFDRDYLAGLASCPAMSSLQEFGLSTHFQGLFDENGERLTLKKAAACTSAVYMQVRRARVLQPRDFQVLNQSVFYYPPADSSIATRLVPLEVVFRFGMPDGSSLTGRLQRDPAYAKVLGLKSLPAEGEMFDRPVLEFFSKLEPKDRLLSLQEALLISGLNESQFKDLAERAQLIALACYRIFARCGIELWDGKLEFILHKGALELADSIGPDELRLLFRGSQLSKEMIRQVYRGSTWESALKQAQKLASERGASDWKSICTSELKASPQPLEPGTKAVVNQLYGVLTNLISGEALFADHLQLDEFVNSAKANGL